MKKVKLSTVIKKYGPFKGPLMRADLSAVPSDKLLNVHVSDGGTWYGSVGFKIVDVLERYASEKPMPDDLHIFDVWFSDDGLKSP